MENSEMKVEIRQPTPTEKLAQRVDALEQHVANLEALVTALVNQAREIVVHRHDANGNVLIPPKVI